MTKSEIIDFISQNEPNETLKDMCYWILSRPEETTSYNFLVDAKEVLRIYSIRLKTNKRHGRKIPGNSDLVTRLSAIPVETKVGGFQYSADCCALMVWMTSEQKYLGITCLIAPNVESTMGLRKLEDIWARNVPQE